MDVEILSPAGSPEGLIASIKGGCDAVYLAGKSFGARASASNFDDGELEGAIKYAHENNVKVNVTVNTLIKDNEMEDAVSFVKFLKSIGADAVIIQDLGLLENIRDIGIPIHASTQMGIHSRKGLEWCAENGISRAILARELTFDEIAEIVKDSPVETEVFVQGALCYCMSGGCLMSSLIGGRSGNRGECAQPCRKRYEKDGSKTYAMSTGDIYAVKYLDRLAEIGITSVKIEGRMRSPAYAYLATKTYVMTRDHEPKEEIAKVSDLLKTVFNRGIGDGYLKGVISPVQATYPDNRGYYIGKVTIKDKKFKTAGLGLSLRDGISIFRGDDKIGGFKLTDANIAVSPFKIQDGVYDIYRTYDPRIDEVKNLIGSAPKFTGSKKRPSTNLGTMTANRVRTKPELSFYVSSLKVLDIVLPFADRIYYDYSSSLKQAQKMCDAADVECVTNLPRFTEDDFAPNDGHPVMIHNPGQYMANRGTKMYGSYILNMFNSSFALPVYQTTLSVELNKSETKHLLDSYRGRVEMMMFGRMEIAFSRDPGMTAGTLKDDKEYVFPVYKDERDCTHILNSSDLLLLDRMGELEAMGVESFGIDLRKRPVLLAKTVAEAFYTKNPTLRPRITSICGSTTSGHYMRGV